MGLLLAIAGTGCEVWAGPPGKLLSADLLHSDKRLSSPVENAAYLPAADAHTAELFSGTIEIQQSTMDTLPVPDKPLIDGRDARLFPGVRLGFSSMGEVLVPVQLGDMVKESLPAKVPSYWQVIPQFGRVWKEPGDGEWSRAAFPLTLVNDTENHAQQGLATFLYHHGAVTGLAAAMARQCALQPLLS